MAYTDAAVTDDLERGRLGVARVLPHTAEMAASAVSWGAIFAGAAGAAALSLILLILGTGLGLSSVSPWSGSGIGATTFGISTILWLTFTQLFASGIGGYLAGRLRTKWASAVHNDEVYFRDTAHGFLAWAVASLATAALLGSAVTSILGTGVQAGAAVAGGAATAATAAAATQVGSSPSVSSSPRGEPVMAYFVDAMFRRGTPAPSPAAAVPAADAASASTTASTMPTSPAMSTPASGGTGRGDANGASASTETARILANAVRMGSLPNEDARYLAQLVAERTGVSQQEAERRVTATFERVQTNLKEAEAAAREAADQARKASAYAALWLFISLLVGAFVASLAATFGGRQRQA